MQTVLLSLGSNLGDREEFLKQAIHLLQEDPDFRFLAQSSVLETEPMDYLDQPRFLNQVVAVSTPLDPWEVLDRLQAIEEKLGRIRTIPKGPRTIDIDILTYGDEVIDHPRLQIPHHSIVSRPFVRVLMEECRIF